MLSSHVGFLFNLGFNFCRRSGGEKIYGVFDNQFPAALKRLQFDKQLSMDNIRKLITEADGYQPHLIAPEQGYRRLIESSLICIRGPAEAAVDAVCIHIFTCNLPRHLNLRNFLLTNIKSHVENLKILNSTYELEVHYITYIFCVDA